MQVDRTVTGLFLYVVGGALAFSIFVFPWATLDVVLYLLAQAMIIAGFCLIGAYAQETFSTDTRGFMFAALDSISKVNSS